MCPLPLGCSIRKAYRTWSDLLLPKGFTLDVCSFGNSECTFRYQCLCQLNTAKSYFVQFRSFSYNPFQNVEWYILTALLIQLLGSFCNYDKTNILELGFETNTLVFSHTLFLWLMGLVWLFKKKSPKYSWFIRLQCFKHDANISLKNNF